MAPARKLVIQDGFDLLPFRSTKLPVFTLSFREREKQKQKRKQTWRSLKAELLSEESQKDQH